MAVVPRGGARTSGNMDTNGTLMGRGYNATYGLKTTWNRQLW